MTFEKLHDGAYGAETINQDRRRLLGAAILTIAAAEFAGIESADAK